MNNSRVKWTFIFVLMLGLGALSTTAHAQAGNWTWGPPGFSVGMSPMDREYYLVNQGLADPLVNYWTPFWSGSSGPNVYTGAFDEGFRNTFAVNHDINANFGIPVLGYLDIFTPLLGTNELAIGSTIASVWNGIVNTVSSVWNSITSLFSRDYSSYTSTGDYSDDGWDNAFDDSYDSYDCGCYGGDGYGG